MPLKFLAVFFLLLILLFNPKLSLAKQLEVVITDQGYNPPNPILEKSDSIIFKNSSSKPAWPASNIHPSHAIYPEFDPKKELKPGQSWEFVFSKPGTWRYHDHLSPSINGQIKVTGEREESNNRKLLSVSDEWKISFSRLYYYFFPKDLETDFKKVNIQIAADQHPQVTGSWMKLVGVKRILEKLLQDSGNGGEVDCHQESHNIGRIAYQLYGSKAFAEGSSICHSGFYHGMIEQFFQEQGSDNFPEKVDGLCSQFNTKFSRFECLHGIGHGIMAYLDYDLPQAIKDCQSLKDAYSAESCYGGVFMENIVVAEGKGTNPGHTTQWVNDDPYFPCNGIDPEERLQTQCYLIQTARMLDLNQYDFDRVIPLCEKAPENMRNICFQSLGRDAAGQVLREANKITSICRKTPDNYFNDCLKGALYVIIEFWGERMENQPHQLCRQLEDTLEKQYCYELIGGRLSGIVGENSGRIDQLCGYSEKDFINACLSSVKQLN